MTKIRYAPLLFLFVFLFFFTACNSSITPPDTPDNPDPPAPTEDLLLGEVSVTKNPYDIAPLTAEAVFTSRVPASVTLSISGGERVTQTFAAATEHRIPILGLYPDTTNEVTLRLESDEGSEEATLAIVTDPLPEGFPTVDILTAQRDKMEAGWNLSSLRFRDDPERSAPFMFDPRGTIRWYFNLPVSGRTTSPERFSNGNIIFGHENKIYEYTMLGEKVNEWDISGYRYHHEIIEKPDGNLIIAVDKDGLGTIEDFAIELNRESGDIVREWDFREVLDIERQTFDDDERDWLHVNALWYDERDDTLILSGRVQGLAKVTMDNELVWILAPHEGWGQNGNGEDTSEYLLTALNAEGEPYSDAIQQGDEDAPDSGADSDAGFSWVWGQHAPLILPNGNLFVFDNGDNRNFSQDGPTFSRGVEYAIDEDAMTVEQVWQYGKARGDEFYSPIISDVDYLPQTGNRLIMPGIVNNFGEPPAYARVTEVSYPEKEVIFEAKMNFKNLFEGESVFGDSVYRSERLPLYPPE